MRRRLLSLDFVLDQPDLPWLATEQEKVARFEQLGIDPELLPKRIYYDRAGRVLTFRCGRGITDAEKEIRNLQLAVDNADWEALEPYGGLDAALRKIHQFEQQNPNFNGPGKIDDFHLWGSRRCRQMGVTLLDGG